MPVKAPIVPAPLIVPVSWTGWYIGLNAGWVGSNKDTITNTGTDTGAGGLGSALGVGLIPTSVGLNEDGFIGGAQVGFNWQVNNWVFGLEGDFDGTSAKADSTVGPITVGASAPVTTTYSRELTWLATVRGRVGFTATPSLLLFATGGLAVGEVKIGNSFICPTCAPPASTQASTSNTSTDTKAGWTVGGGIEWMFAPHWSLKAEYLYVDLGTHDSTITYTYGANTSTMTSSVKEQFSVARAGVNFHF
jgi:outer membrane immunogenic protein